MEWHRIAYFVPMVPLRTYSLTHPWRDGWAIQQAGNIDVDKRLVFHPFLTLNSRSNTRKLSDAKRSLPSYDSKTGNSSLVFLLAYTQRIRGFAIMRYRNLLLTLTLTYFARCLIIYRVSHSFCSSAQPNRSQTDREGLDVFTPQKIKRCKVRGSIKAFVSNNNTKTKWRCLYVNQCLRQSALTTSASNWQSKAQNSITASLHRLAEHVNHSIRLTELHMNVLLRSTACSHSHAIMKKPVQQRR